MKFLQRRVTGELNVSDPALAHELRFILRRLQHLFLDKVGACARK